MAAAPEPLVVEHEGSGAGHHPEASQPCAPRQVDVVTVHEEALVVEKPHCGDDVATDEHAGPTGPARVAVPQVVLPGVFERQLSALNDSDAVRGACTNDLGHEVVSDEGVGVEHKQPIRKAVAEEEVLPAAVTEVALGPHQPELVHPG